MDFCKLVVIHLSGSFSHNIQVPGCREQCLKGWKKRYVHREIYFLGYPCSLFLVFGHSWRKSQRSTTRHKASTGFLGWGPITVHLCKHSLDERINSFYHQLDTTKGRGLPVHSGRVCHSSLSRWGIQWPSRFSVWSDLANHWPCLLTKGSQILGIFNKMLMGADEKKVSFEGSMEIFLKSLIALYVVFSLKHLWWKYRQKQVCFINFAWLEPWGLSAHATWLYPIVPVKGVSLL